MSLIGIIGKKSSGKTTLGNRIAILLGGVEYAFADPLKSVCSIVYDLDHEQLYGEKKEVIELQTRQADQLQKLIVDGRNRARQGPPDQAGKHLGDAARREILLKKFSE